MPASTAARGSSWGGPHRPRRGAWCRRRTRALRAFSRVTEGRRPLTTYRRAGDAEASRNGCLRRSMREVSDALPGQARKPGDLRWRKTGLDRRGNKRRELERRLLLRGERGLPPHPDVGQPCSQLLNGHRECTVLDRCSLVKYCASHRPKCPRAVDAAGGVAPRGTSRGASDTVTKAAVPFLARAVLSGPQPQEESR